MKRLAAALILSWPALAAAQAEAPDLEHGATLWGKCRACHTIEPGGRHIVGPNLHGIFGQRAGTRPGYAYSPVMAASRVVWTEATMDAFLEATQDFMPGSTMYGGLSQPDERRDLIAWMKRESERRRAPP